MTKFALKSFIIIVAVHKVLCDYGTRCTSDSDCDGLVCDGGICRCAETDHVIVSFSDLNNTEKVFCKAKETCTTYVECPNSGCIGGYCACAEGKIWVTAARGIVDGCWQYEKLERNSECSARGKICDLDRRLVCLDRRCTCRRGEVYDDVGDSLCLSCENYKRKHNTSSCSGKVGMDCNDEFPCGKDSQDQQLTCSRETFLCTCPSNCAAETTRPNTCSCGLMPGEIVGIVIAVILLLVLIALGLYVFKKHRYRKLSAKLENQ